MTVTEEFVNDLTKTAGYPFALGVIKQAEEKYAEAQQQLKTAADEHGADVVIQAVIKLAERNIAGDFDLEKVASIWDSIKGAWTNQIQPGIQNAVAGFDGKNFSGLGGMAGGLGGLLLGQILFPDNPMLGVLLAAGGGLGGGYGGQIGNLFNQFKDGAGAHAKNVAKTNVGNAVHNAAPPHRYLNTQQPEPDFKIPAPKPGQPVAPPSAEPLQQANNRVQPQTNVASMGSSTRGANFGVDPTQPYVANRFQLDKPLNSMIHTASVLSPEKPAGSGSLKDLAKGLKLEKANPIIDGQRITFFGNGEVKQVPHALLALKTTKPLTPKIKL